MKYFLISFIIFFSSVLCWSQTKQLDIYFPESGSEKEVTLRYSIYDISSYVYEPYHNTQKTTDNHLTFTIPDSISTFSIVMPSNLPYKWGYAGMILMKPGGKLAIYLDSIQPPKFEGDNAALHNFVYQFKKGTGMERSQQTLIGFMEDSSITSFYDFVCREMAESNANLDMMLTNKNIDILSYQFAKDQFEDEYLFRTSLISEVYSKDLFSKVDSTSFYADLNKLFTQYDKTYAWSISVLEKAKLRAFGLIPSEKLDLGLDSIYRFCSYLNKQEQEKIAASEIIINTVIGQLDSLQLISQRSKFKEVFPHSVYNGVIDQLTPLSKKDYILAHYSKEQQFQEFGRLKSNDLRKITSMFMGGRPVLVDFWATWCGPCIKEFEHREKLLEFLAENNIGIIYVSLDFPGAYDQWKKLIENKQLEGFHYFGTQEFGENSPYFKNNKFIPYYVLLDTDGSVLIEQCELPSSGKLIPQIKEKLGLK